MRCLLIILLLNAQSLCAQKTLTTDVLVIGGGVGGTAAGIQCARMGAKTMIVESGPWLGGMVSAAGVSAVDGNHLLPSGIWAEFREQLYKVYGGVQGVATGWVSNTQFEPHVADSIFKQLAAREKNLTTIFNLTYTSLRNWNNSISTVQFVNRLTGERIQVKAAVFIDATELGEVLKSAGVPYDLGLEAGFLTGENVGVQKSSPVVQDLTWVAVLKDFGDGKDYTIPKPANYSPAEFDGCCTDYYHDKTRKAPTVDARKMLDYGKLPHNKYMLNWPGYGNDTYLNVIEMNDAARERELNKARQTTLRFVYFIQHELGFKNLGLAPDEFPTSDQLALMPYHREGRRARGLVRMTLRNISEPFAYGDPLYRTGVSVGDYPVDHHHKKNLSAPQQLEFYPVPSFNIPLGALIPQRIDNLIIAEKAISVSNVANGTTRLQPCVMLTGQAAGTLAALCVQKNTSPQKIPVRTVQASLLRSKAFIMPYLDVKPDHPHFEAVQKIGATGILKGKGIPHKWANQTWFYPDSLVDAARLKKDLVDFDKKQVVAFTGRFVNIQEAIKAATLLHNGWYNNKNELPAAIVRSAWQTWGLNNFDPGRMITRLELAVLLQRTVDPFTLKAVNHHGNFIN